MAKSYNRRINLYINGKEVKNDISSIKKEMWKLINEQARMTRGSDEYISHTKKIRALRSILDQHNQQLRQTGNSWMSLKKTADGFNRYTTMFTAIAATITGLVFSVKSWIDGMVTLDDALSDVMKTTGMTKEEVRGLYDEFKNLNTRTSRRELLLLAEEAGRLGKKSKKDVMDFVEVANQITVALGDDLGDAKTAVKEVGKLTNIYKVGSQYGTDFKESMSKVGSAINEVSANSSAQADYLIGYLKRMGGVADQADVNASQILGYASALDQLGQTQEMAATAHGKVMIDMFKDHAKYAEIAKMESDEFSELLQTDANEAFLKLLEGLNGSNDGMTVMAKKLDELGVDGARAVQVLSALASNTELVRKEQNIANDAMDKGISLVQEYNTKNENFAGSFAKIGQYIHSKFINSSFLGWLEKVIGKMAEWTKVDISEKLKEQQKNVNLLAIEMTNANTPAKRRNDIYKELQEIAPEVVSNIDKENISVSTLRKNLEQYNMAMIKKLALQDSELALEKEREKAGEATKERVEEEVKLIEELQTLPKYLERFNKWEGLGNLSDDVEEIILSSDDLVSKVEKIDELLKGLKDEDGNSLRFYVKSPGTDVFRILKDVKSAREEEEKATNAVTKAMEEYMAQYDRVFGEQKEVKNQVDPTQKTNKQIVSVLTPQEKAELEKKTKEKELLEEKLAEKTKEIRRQLRLSEMDAQAKELAEMEIKYADLYALAKEYEIDTTELAKLHLDEKLKLQKKHEDDRLEAKKEVENKIVQLVGSSADKEKLEITKKYAELIKLAKEYKIDTTELYNQMNEELDRVDSGHRDVLGMNEEDWDKFKNNMNEAIQIAQGLGSVWSNINQIRANQEQKEYNRFEKETNKKKALLNDQLESGEISQEKYNAKVAKLDDELEKKRVEMARKQAKRDKALRMFETVTNTASAVVEALPNIPLSIIAGAIGATQLAVIASEPLPEFAIGGFTNGARAYIAGEAGTEWIASNDMVNDPTTGPVIQQLEMIRKGLAPKSSIVTPLNPDFQSMTSMPMFSNGGFTGSQTSNNYYSSSSKDERIDEMIALMTDQAEEIKLLRLYLSDPENRKASLNYDLMKKANQEMEELRKVGALG